MAQRYLPERKRVLLTGATGFVGRQIHRALLEQDHDVRTVIRKGSATCLVDGGEGDYRETLDLFQESQDWWAATCRGIDTVVHAAWFVAPGRYLSAKENLTCVTGSIALALGALDAGVEHVVGIGTCFEYQLPSDHLTVDSPLAPTTLYAASKLALFEMLRALFAASVTPFSWVRLFYLYGEGEHPTRFVPYLRDRLVRDEIAELSIGTQIRDFLDVSDAGAMIATIVSTGQVGAINVCSGEPVTIRQLAERTADAFGRRDLLRFGTAPLRLTDPPAVVGVCNLDRPELCKGKPR